MISKTAFILTLILLSTSQARRDPCQDAYHDCEFRFMGLRQSSPPIISLDGVADRAVTPRIISLAPHERLGILNSNGIIAEVIADDGTVAPITAFGNPPFSPTHIKPFRIPHTAGSGLGHETFVGNQFELARDATCVRVFFTSYQVLRGRRIVRRNLNEVMARRMNKCVVLITG